MCDWFILPFPLGLRQSGLHWIVSARIITGVGRKWKRSDSLDSDSVMLMTLNTTEIFDFHKVMSALTTPLTIPTPTPSLVKTSVKPECLPINLTKLPGTGTLTAIARRTAHYLRYSMLIHQYPAYHTIPFIITSHLVSIRSWQKVTVSFFHWNVDKFVRILHVCKSPITLAEREWSLSTLCRVNIHSRVAMSSER